LRGKDAFYCLQEQRADGAIFARKVQARHPQRGGIWTFFPVSHVGNVSIANYAAADAQNASKQTPADANWATLHGFWANGLPGPGTSREGV
jgi:hypothetical protein